MKIAPQPTLRREGSLIFVSWVRIADLLRCLKARKSHAPLGIEAMPVCGTPSLELVRACIRFDDDSALADDAFVHLSRALLPSCESTGHDLRVFKDRKKIPVLPCAGEPKHTNRANAHPFHLNLLVTALRESFAAYLRGSEFSSGAPVSSYKPSTYLLSG